jgi:hypothetical protein
MTLVKPQMSGTFSYGDYQTFISTPQ